MGLFDKLKVAIKSAAKEEVKEEVKEEAAEDLSGATIMDLIEKVDQYVTEFKKNMNKATYKKMEIAMKELGSRQSSIPMAKRVHCRPYFDSYESALDTFKKALTIGPTGKSMVDVTSSTLLLAVSGMASVLAE